MSRLAIVALAAACVALSGCAATYTSIRRADDGTYFITRTKQNALTAWGTLHHCTASPDGRAMRCETVGEP